MTHIPKTRTPLLDRFAKLQSGCWEWQFETNGSKYGVYVVCGNGKYTRKLAHRAVYEHIVGPIPAGLELDHLCRNTMCVNPAHLEPVTHRENVLRGTSPNAINARKTHCKRGHLLSGDNLYKDKRSPTQRLCLTCRRLRDKNRVWKKPKQTK